MTIGIVAFGSSFLFASVVCVCAHKAPLRGARRQGDVETANPGLGLDVKKDKLELDLEDASNSTVASSQDIASRRFLAEQHSASPTSSSLSRLSSFPFRASPQTGSRLGGQHGSSPAGRSKDTGAGLGTWDVPEEFEEEELTALNQKSLTEHSVQVSEHTPAATSVENVLYGKPS